MKNQVGFIFSGVGGRWLESAFDLIEAEPEFRSGLAKWSDRFESQGLGWSVIEHIRAASQSTKNSAPDIATSAPCLSAIQLTLLEMAKLRGLQPSKIVGHSVGEAVASYASGLISEKELISIVVARCMLEKRMPVGGGLLVAGIGREAAMEIIQHHEGVEVGGENSAMEVILSGPTSVLKRVEERLIQAGRFVRRVNVDGACHSGVYDGLHSHFEPRFSGEFKSLQVTPYFSSTNGSRTENVRNRHFWIQCMREPAKFRSALAAAFQAGVDTIYEVAVSPILSHSIDACAQECRSPVSIRQMIIRDESGLRFATKDELGECARMPEKEVKGSIHLLLTGLLKRYLASHRPGNGEVSLPQVAFEKARFFELGLDSLDITRLAFMFSEELGVKVHAVDMFNYPSIETLGAHLLSSTRRPRSVQSDWSAEAANELSTGPTAIVGMACKFPGANGLEEYWKFLTNGRSAIVSASGVRWPESSKMDSGDGFHRKLSSSKAGLVDGVDEFDPVFFGITPNEAMRMDPQQRILMQVAWHAIEDAGLTWRELRGQNVGVFIGAMNTNDYVSRKESAQQSDAWTSPYDSVGSANSALAGRLSYFLETTGPAITVDTACSSSLVALHQALGSLELGEIDIAIVGGVNVILSPWTSVAYSNSNMLSPDGECRTFDAAANGYVRGEGCGVLVVCSRAHAERHQLRTHALILGSAVNQNGRGASLTAPNGNAQHAVITKAQQKAKVSPSEVAYVEAHGTGTPLGDPIEMEALQRVMNGRGRRDKWFVGSVKTNFGHLEAAAGMAGLIKTVLAIKHASIPPHLNLKEINPQITLDEGLTEIPLDTCTWPDQYAERLAGVSSFGFTGSNAHVVLSAVQQIAPTTGNKQTSSTRLVLPVSAKTEGALEKLAMAYRTQIADSSIAVAALCRTAQMRRIHHKGHRMCLSAENSTELKEQLDDRVRNLKKAKQGAISWKRVAMIFSGQGAFYPLMGKHLYETFEVFREAYDRCVKVCEAHDIDLMGVMIDPMGAALSDTKYAQPSIFALQACLVMLLDSWGVKPNIVAGHSLGEYGAAFAAGSLSLETGMRLVCVRARLMSAMPHGAMLDVKLSLDEFTQMDPVAEIDVAAVNAADRIVLAGEEANVRKWETHFERVGVQSRRIDVSHAFHSHLMNGALMGMAEAVSKSDVQVGPVPMISTVTGEQLSGRPDALNATYWVNNIRQTVLFDKAMRTLQEHKPDVVLEIGPNGVLLKLAKVLATTQKLAVLNGGGDEVDAVLNVLTSAYEGGTEIDWGRISALGDRPGMADMPLYPFEQGHYMAPFTQGASVPVHDETDDSSGFKVSNLEFNGQWRALIHEHRIYGMPVVPGAALVAQLIKNTGMNRRSDGQLKNVKFELPLTQPANVEVLAKLNVSGLQCTVTKAEQGGDQAYLSAELSGDQLPLDEAHGQAEPGGSAALEHKGSGARLRESWQDRGLYLGPTLATVQRIQRTGAHISAEIHVPMAEQESAEIRLAKALDGVLQCAGWYLYGRGDPDLWLPKAIGSVNFVGEPAGKMIAQGTLIGLQEKECASNWVLSDEDGKTIAKFQNVVLASGQRDSIMRSVWRDGLKLLSPEDLTFKRTGTESSLNRAIKWLGETSPLKARLETTLYASPKDRSDSVVEAVANVYVASCDKDPLERDACESMLRSLAQAAQAASEAPHTKFFVVMDGGDSPAGDAIKAFTRSLSIEEPSVWGGGLNLTPPVGSEVLIQTLAELIANPTAEWMDVTGDSVTKQNLVPVVKAEQTQEWVPLDKFYVIIGGLGAVGRSFAECLVEHGVSKLLILSRRGPDEQVQEKLQLLADAGVVIQFRACDISELHQLTTALHEYKGKIGGIVHCAGVLNDGLLHRQSDRDRASVYAPKISGVINLHLATLNEAMNLFICTSSIASYYGAAGQTAYAAANGYMEGFVRFRRRLGLPAQYISWPAWIGQGMAAQNDNAGNKYWESRGFNSIDVNLAKWVIEQVVLGQNAGVVVDTRTLKQEKSQPAGKARALLSVDGRDAGKRITSFEKTLFDALKKAFPTSVGNVLPEDSSLRDLGLDSLDLIELKGALVDAGFPVTNQDLLADIRISLLCEKFESAGRIGAEEEYAGQTSTNHIMSVIAEVCGQPMERIDQNTDTLMGLGFDSFQFIELATKLKAKGLTATNQFLMAERTISELCELLLHVPQHRETPAGSMSRNKEERTLKSELKAWEDVEPLSSKFIRSAWREEEYDVESMQYQGAKAYMTFVANKFQMPADGVFHLPLFYSFFWVEVLIKGFFTQGAYKHLAVKPVIRRMKMDLPSRITSSRNMAVQINIVEIGGSSKADVIIEGDGRWQGEIWFDLPGVNQSDIWTSGNQIQEIKPNEANMMKEEVNARSRSVEMSFENFKFDAGSVLAGASIHGPKADITLFNWARWGSQLALIYAYNKIGLAHKPKNESYVLSAELNIDGYREIGDSIEVGFFAEKEILDNDVLYLSGAFEAAAGISFKIKVTAPLYDFQLESAGIHKKVNPIESTVH